MIIKKIFILFIFIGLVLVLVLDSQSCDAKGRDIIIIFRYDDYSGISDVETEKAILNLAEKYGVKQTYGVIPNIAGDKKNPAICKYTTLEDNRANLELLQEVSAARNVEIALHGFSHQTFKKHPVSEFNKVPQKIQKEKIRQGKAFLEDWFNTKIDVFIPPWNSYGKTTIKVLEQEGFKVVSGMIGKYGHTPNDIVDVLKEITLIPATTFLGDTFKQAINFARKLDETAFIIVLYHEFELRKNGFLNLEPLKEAFELVSESDDIKVMTLGEVAEEYSDEFKVEDILAYQKLSKYYQQLSSYRNVPLVGSIVCMIMHNLSWCPHVYLKHAPSFYERVRLKIFLGIGFFWLCVALAAVGCAYIFIFISRYLRQRKKAIVSGAIFSAILTVFVVLECHFGFFTGEVGIGAQGRVIIVFFITFTVSLLLGYWKAYNLETKKGI